MEKPKAGAASNTTGNQEMSYPGDLPKVTELLKSLLVGKKGWKETSDYYRLLYKCSENL